MVFTRCNAMLLSLSSLYVIRSHLFSLVCFRCRIEGGGRGRGGVDGGGLLFSSAYLNSSSTLCHVVEDVVRL